MASLFDKIGLLFSASTHELVNKALRANSVAVLTEQIRRANESLDELDDTTAVVLADQKIEQRKNRELVAVIAQLSADAMTLLRAGKDAQAAVMVKQKQLKEAALQKSNDALVSMGKDVDKLQQARAMLQMKISELQQTRDNVEQALKIARTKGRVVKTFEALTDILEESGAQGISDWAEQVKVKADVKLEMTLQKAGNLIDPMSDGGVAAEIERMKAQMNQ
ncbi:MAG: hypothetical protein WC560_12580 [Syntrophales bacterium]